MEVLLNHDSAIVVMPSRYIEDTGALSTMNTRANFVSPALLGF